MDSTRELIVWGQQRRHLWRRYRHHARRRTFVCRVIVAEVKCIKNDARDSDEVETIVAQPAREGERSTDVMVQRVGDLRMDFLRQGDYGVLVRSAETISPQSVLIVDRAGYFRFNFAALAWNASDSW